MAKQEKLEGNDVCVCIHTALRKACDSKPTSLLYNLIHMMNLDTPMEPWRFFGAAVAERLGGKKKPAEIIAALSEDFFDVWFEKFMQQRGEKGFDEAEQQAQTLSCALQLCDKGDFEGMAAYL